MCNVPNLLECKDGTKPIENCYVMGVQKKCLPPDLLCNGEMDCDNGIDEQGCSTTSTTTEKTTSTPSQYFFFSLM